MPKPEPGIAVRCRGITKTYGIGAARVAALRGVDLDVREGELLMLVGPSGCGKSTLLAIVTTLLNADGGACALFGRDVRSMDQNERARVRGVSVGFVFQFFNLLPALTAVENVAVPLLLHGVRRNEAEGRARKILEDVGLAERMEARPTRMSGGEQQRVAIARALVHQPQLIVCDEPTSSVDHETGMQLMRLLREEGRRSGATIVVVTHDDRVLSFADRLAHMDDGAIVDIVETRAGGAFPDA